MKLLQVMKTEDIKYPYLKSLIWRSVALLGDLKGRPVHLNWSFSFCDIFPPGLIINVFKFHLHFFSGLSLYAMSKSMPKYLSWSICFLANYIIEINLIWNFLLLMGRNCPSWHCNAGQKEMKSKFDLYVLITFSLRNEIQHFTKLHKSTAAENHLQRQ